MKAAAKGKLNGYLLEGMACPGGCIAGAGTLAPIQKTSAMVGMYARRSPHKHADESGLEGNIPELVREDDYKNLGANEIAETEDAMGTAHKDDAAK